MALIRRWFQEINARPWAWRTIHALWGTLLARVQPGTGAVWYASQETNQARAAGKLQWKNLWDFLAGCLGEALGWLWRHA